MTKSSLFPVINAHDSLLIRQCGFLQNAVKLAYDCETVPEPNDKYCKRGMLICLRAADAPVHYQTILACPLPHPSLNDLVNLYNGFVGHWDRVLTDKSIYRKTFDDVIAKDGLYIDKYFLMLGDLYRTRHNTCTPSSPVGNYLINDLVRVITASDTGGRADHLGILIHVEQPLDGTAVREVVRIPRPVYLPWSS